MDPWSPCILSLLVFFPGGGDSSSSPTPQPRCGAAADVAWDMIDWQRHSEWEPSERALWAGLYRWLISQVCLRGSLPLGGVSAKATGIWLDGQRPSAVKLQHIHTHTHTHCVCSSWLSQLSGLIFNHMRLRESKYIYSSTITFPATCISFPCYAYLLLLTRGLTQYFFF